jgi:hypothetical protein
MNITEINKALQAHLTSDERLTIQSALTVAHNQWLADSKTAPELKTQFIRQFDAAAELLNTLDLT